MATKAKHPLIHYLTVLYKQGDRGPLASLRDHAFDPDNAEVFEVVGDHLPQNASQTTTDAYLVVATLFAQYIQPFVADRSRPTGQLQSNRSIMASARLLRDSITVGQDSLTKRITATINSHRDDLPNLLRHLIRRLSSERIEVDFDVLLSDLLQWNRDPRPVRRRWSEDYWQREPGS
jgi:CRISPR type I-E-associated protein CasB/Cse2